MSRIAGLSGGTPDARVRQLADMLAVYPGGAAQRRDGPKGALGLKPHGPGGLARHPKGLLVLDGLLYDLPERRAEAGLPDGSDVDVLAELIARHGLPGALARVNGDYALAWMEAQTGTLWLARDPFGLRPLFYARSGGGWAFSSQPRGLLQLPDVPATPDRGFLARFGAMHYRMIDNEPDRSPYAAIGQVMSGTALRLGTDGSAVSQAFWTMQDRGDFDRSEEDLAEEYRARLMDAVARRIARFPKRAFTLSGGMDSSSVLASAVAIEDRKQIAFSTLYEDPTYDEREEIADMLAHHVADWRRVVLPDAIDIAGDVDRLIGLHDEPVATATWLSHMRLCRQAASGGEFDSIFGGLGGDELNAGEYEYFPLHFADLKYAGQDGALDHEVSLWAEYHDHPVFKKNRAVADELIARLTDATRPGACLPDRKRLGRYLHVLSRDFAEFRDYSPVMETVFSSCLKTRTWQDLSRETLPCCVRAEDRHGSAFGLPPVLPFLDRDLVEFMYRVPGSLKIRDGITKRLLRRAMIGVLPEATRNRVKKTGWNAPAHLWFSGEGAQMLRDLAHSTAFDDLGLYDRTAVLAIIDDHERIVTSGAVEDNHMMFLWPFLNIMRWQGWLKDGGFRRPITV